MSFKMHRSLLKLGTLASTRPSGLVARSSRKWPVASSLLNATQNNLLDFQLRSKSTAATATYDQSIDSFPSIVIGPNGSITPQGTFAEAQAEVSLEVYRRKTNKILEATDEVFQISNPLVPGS